MNRPISFLSAGIAKQVGIATVGIALLLLIFMGVAILAASTLATGVLRDSVSEGDRVQALYMAETGVERASYRFNSGIACANLSESAMTMTSTSGANLGTVSITAFTTAFDGVSSVGSSCRIRAIATTSSGQIVRTIESMLNPTSTSTRGNRAFTCDIPTGTNEALIVGVSWTSAKTDDFTIAGVSFNGVGLTQVDTATVQTDTSNRYKAQNWYLLNPTTGTNISGVIFFNGGSPTSVVFGCTIVGGVSTPSGFATPIETSNSNIGNSTTPVVTVTTTSTTGVRYIVDDLARDSGSNYTAQSAGCSGTRTGEWTDGSSRNGGGGSNCGTVGPSTTTTMNWSGSGASKAWAMSAFSIFATTYLGKDSGRIKANGTGSGISGWREITVPPS